MFGGYLENHPNTFHRNATPKESQMLTEGAMTDADWKALTHLTLIGPHNWGDATKIDRRVIMLLDEMLNEIPYQCLVTCGTRGLHIEGSYHYPVGGKLGLALDIMFKRVTRQQLPDILFTILRYPFTGIGIYSEWRFAKELPAVGGFHLDVRPTSRKALWLKGDGTLGYEALNLANIEKYFTRTDN